MRTSESKPGPAISRRAMREESGAMPLPSSQLPASCAASMETIQLCKSWLANEAQSNRLAGQWSAVERHLVKHYRWFDLSEAEQIALAEAAELRSIEGQLQELSEASAHVIPDLTSLAATNRTAILLKFKVLAHALRREDYQDEYALLHSALRDLEAAWR